MGECKHMDPWILRNSLTFRAAPCIRVSLDTRHVKFALVIMSEDGDLVESSDAIEWWRNSEACPITKGCCGA
jgi:hypothetical protein